MDDLDEAMNGLRRLAPPSAERFAAMERRLFADLHADARARSLGRAGIAAAAAVALGGGLIAGATEPRPAAIAMGAVPAFAPSSLLAGG